MPQKAGEKPKYIVWQEINSVGHAMLDNEHRQLVDILNRLFEAVSEPKACGANGLKAILDDVVHYTERHFFDEEAILKKTDYPDLIQHVALHRNMRAKTSEIKSVFLRNRNPQEACDLLRFLREWWINHINTIDRQYTSYVKSSH